MSLSFCWQLARQSLKGPQLPPTSFICLEHTLHDIYWCIRSNTSRGQGQIASLTLKSGQVPQPRSRSSCQAGMRGCTQVFLTARED